MVSRAPPEEDFTLCFFALFLPQAYNIRPLPPLICKGFFCRLFHVFPRLFQRLKYHGNCIHGFPAVHICKLFHYAFF